jgi:hypothetical protein
MRMTSSTLPAAIVLPLLLLGASGATAQQGSPPRPGYQVLRFNEDWAPFADAGPRGPLDALKFVPLNADRSAYLSFGGQLRQRFEGVRNFMLGGPGTRDDAFSLTRAMAHADLHLGESLRFFVEAKHAVAHGRELPGGRRSLDHDELDVQNAFVDLVWPGDAGRLTTRLGRQELLLGRQRLVSPLDWANTRRTFEGARLHLQRRTLDLEAFWTRPVAVRISALNRGDPATTFYGLAASSPATAPATWQLYGLGLRQTEAIRFAGLEGTQHRVTVGARFAAGRPDSGVRTDLEGGVQAGDLAGRSIRAWFVASDFSHNLQALPLRPTATLGLDWASGDRARNDRITGTFHQLFPLGHAYAGHADILGRQNLAEARLVLEAPLHRRVRTRAAAHQFLRASRDDGVYGVGGALLEPAAGRPQRAIGTELDLLATLELTRHARAEAGFARFVPGDFLRERPAGAKTADWAYLSATFTF